MSSNRTQLLHQTLKRALFVLDPQLSIQEQRRRIETLARLIIHLPKGVTKESVRVGKVEAEWIVPVKSNVDTAVLYLHGGCYTLCSPATHRGLTGAIALACKSRMLVPNYRLAPEHPFPAALEDAIATYRWLLAQGLAPHHIAIGGDSAGGGLTLATALCLRDSGDPLPAALFLLSPWTDLTFSGESHNTRRAVDPIFGGESESKEPFAPAYLGQETPSNPLISPLLADLRGLPATIIHVGDDEILLDDSTRLGEKMEAAGVDVRIRVWDGLWHVFQAFVPFLPEARQSVAEIGEFIRRRIK
ncbi:MAG: alpha/beta hydrolase [Chloroflexi bacterium]|nr:alpha/beta hydrolase [Chloroflexota bacterium]